MPSVVLHIYMHMHAYWDYTCSSNICYMSIIVLHGYILGLLGLPYDLVYTRAMKVNEQGGCFSYNPRSYPRYILGLLGPGILSL